ncbi:hypothetical protein RvY_17739-1 [Ramazzottius varieornatus]|uniref:Protein quiver n=1 Tax=Ramazzottius varieornatus TaxID=947166 RepID=A0A1D1W374_RAMVA|nr:hypothetical protein RvY_17739-1 [Ramazzottius varieornatus]
MIAETLSLTHFLVPVSAIFCYQCATDQPPSSDDRCGTRGSFRPDEHAVVDCGRDEATSPGQMCLKYTELSPRAFIRDKRWKSVIRRCAQVSSRGQLQGCDWGYDSNGSIHIFQ